MTADGYQVPLEPAQAVEVIRRSRFTTDLGRASTVDEARAFVARVREADPSATHHCWAYVVGPPGSTAHVGFSDDGEPHGTAGQPMLTALLHSDVGDIVAVCTRRYGGAKLGTGGLARAYAGGVKAALNVLRTVQKVSRIPCQLTVDYTDVDTVRRLTADRGILVDAEEFGARVVFACRVPERDWEAFEKLAADSTSGRAAVVRTGEPTTE